MTLAQREDGPLVGIGELAGVQPPKARCGRFLLGLVRTAGRSKWATRKEKHTSATRRFLLRSSA